LFYEAKQLESGLVECTGNLFVAPSNRCALFSKDVLRLPDVMARIERCPDCEQAIEAGDFWWDEAPFPTYMVQILQRPGCRGFYSHRFQILVGCSRAEFDGPNGQRISCVLLEVVFRRVCDRQTKGSRFEVLRLAELPPLLKREFPGPLYELICQRCLDRPELAIAMI